MQLGLRQKLETCKSLPSLPAVAVHVLRLCQRENFDIADVARAIGNDGPLAAKVLGLVNSPLFGMRQEVRTVSHALVLLGVNSVRTIALSFALVSDMRAHERSGFDYRTYWKRAIFAAAAAQDLARVAGARHPEEAFLAALLQDVGEVALAQALTEQYQTMASAAPGDHDRLVGLEKRTFGCDHAEVGRWLMTRWRLPEAVRAAVGSSHEPGRWQRGVDPATETTVKVVALSGALADLWVHPDVAHAARLARTRAHEIAGLDADSLLPLMRRITRSVLDIAPLFNLWVGEPAELEAVIEAVNQALTEETTPRAAPSAGAAGEDEADGPDRLTGLASRATFDQYLAEQFDLAQQVGKPLSVILCDPDHLEMVNQAFGRAAGDRALAVLGALLGERLRFRDLAARYGGEEFALILTDTHAAGAAVVAERLRKKVEDTQHDIGIGDPVRMTVSIGCVTLDEALAFQSPADLMRAAESTLALAKNAGRNRVMSFTNFHVAA
ncbi:MAG: GGDEF domain-containing protein [Myxococcales bacterium]